MNPSQVLLITGYWDAAEAELDGAIDGDGLTGIESVACYRAWLAALRGPVRTAAAAGSGDS